MGVYRVVYAYALSLVRNQVRLGRELVAKKLSPPSQEYELHDCLNNGMSNYGLPYQHYSLHKLRTDGIDARVNHADIRELVSRQNFVLVNN